MSKKMSERTYKKAVALMLIMVLTLAQFVGVGILAKDSIATYATGNLETQNSRTQHKNIEFDSYFETPDGESHSSVANIEEGTKLVFKLKVGNQGFLKDAKITLSNTNYAISGEIEDSNVIQSIVDGNQIILKQIEPGTEVIFAVPITMSIGTNRMFKDNINKDSQALFTGTNVAVKDGKEVTVEKEIIVNLGWESNPEFNMENKVIEYMPYEKGTEKGVIVKTHLTISKNRESLPIQQTNIEIEVPKLAGSNPTRVLVSSIKTGLTNGQTYEKTVFDQSNWNYNEESRKLNITVENKELKGTLYTGQDSDEYVITYVYGETSFSNLQDTNSFTNTLKLLVKMYNNKELKEISKTASAKETLSEKIPGVVSSILIPNKTNIAKGNIYANYNNSEKIHETEFDIKQIVNIAEQSKVGEITLKPVNDSVVDTEGKEYNLNNYTYYKSIKIAKANFEKLLGQDGTIQILNSEGHEIGTIDKNTKIENDYFVFTFNARIGDITLKLSDPKENGNLMVNYVKVINTNMPYSKEQVKTFTKIVSKIQTEYTFLEVIVEQTTTETEMLLEDSKTKVSMSTNKTAVVKETEKLEIKLELNNNHVGSDLYKNPRFTFEFPSFVENVEIEDVNVLFEEELQLGKTEIITNSEGNKELIIELDGTQTTFNTIPNTNGTNVLANLTLTNKQEVGEGTIKLSVSNESAVAYENEGIVESTLLSVIEIEELQVGAQGTESPVEEGETESQEREKIAVEAQSYQEGKTIRPGQTISYEVKVLNKNLDENGNLIIDIEEEEEEILEDEEVTEGIDDGEEVEGEPKQPELGIKNIEVKTHLPSGVSFESATIRVYNAETDEMEDVTKGVTYNAQTREVVWAIGDMLYEDFHTINLNVVAMELSEKEYNKEIQTVFSGSYKDSKLINSNKIKVTVVKSYIEGIKTSENLKETNKVGDEVVFKLTAKNVGMVDDYEFNMNFKVPTELEIKEVTYGILANEEKGKEERLTTTSFGENEMRIPYNTLEAGDTVVAYVTTEIKELDKTLTSKYKEVSVEANIKEELVTWDLKIANSNLGAEPGENGNENGNENNGENGNNDPSNPNNNNNTNKYSISGLAWNDENRNGVKETSEEILKGIKIKLVNVSTTVIIKETITDDKGKYKFDELAEGEYQLIFMFEENGYTVTDYLKGTDGEVNSNAIKSNPGLALTDVIKITNKDIEHINIGLVSIPKFDFSLQKYISRIVVQNGDGTRTQEYNNTQLAKIDINPKYVNSTTILVEYKIIVKNEGELAGKLKKAIDYMPREMEFPSDLNSAWVKDANGDLYNTELKDLNIEPGESKELTLVLRKRLTEDNIGIINNTAEIAEVSNEENLADINSVPANKAQGENDMSSANAIISLKTGQEVIYIIILIVALLGMQLGMYIINKRALGKMR